MKIKMTALLVAASSLAFLTAVSSEPAGNSNAAEAKNIVKTFATSLQDELQAAIKEGGPVKAIAVCKERAPAIAQGLSDQTGWEVGRTSLKLRNSTLNAPDDWERQVMLRFDERRAAGEDVQTMAYAEVVEKDGSKQFRFMKAIPTGEVCLACHGNSIAPTVATALDEAYPDDLARGYNLGDVRGAFTLSKSL